MGKFFVLQPDVSLDISFIYLSIPQVLMSYFFGFHGDNDENEDKHLYLNWACLMGVRFGSL